MAEKEERIYIKIFKKDVCKNCYDDKYCKTHNIKCDCKIDYNEALTRQEAINKIRIAMHKVFIKQEPAGPLFLNYAEAALNALLEGVKLWQRKKKEF